MNRFLRPQPVFCHIVRLVSLHLDCSEKTWIFGFYFSLSVESGCDGTDLTHVVVEKGTCKVPIYHTSGTHHTCKVQVGTGR